MPRSQPEQKQQRKYASNSITGGHKKSSMAEAQDNFKKAMLNVFSDLKEDMKIH